MTEQPELSFILRKLDQVLNEIGQLRDEMLVQTAILERVDASVQALTKEVRAVHRQISRMNDRIRKLEDEQLEAGHDLQS